MSILRLKHITIMPFAIWLSLISAIVGFLFGIFFALISFPTFGFRYGVSYILVWILVTPTVFAVIGLLASLIGAAIYNALVRSRGGMLFEFEERTSKSEPPPPPNF
jgi:hypothetical protein